MRRARIVNTLYAITLILAAIGAAMASTFDAPYGALVALEEALWAVLGGLLFYPVVAVAAWGARGAKKGLAVAAAALLGLVLLQPLHARLYQGYAGPEALTLTHYVASAPLVYLLSVGLGLSLLLYPLWALWALLRSLLG
jgi:hypothetical protein